jgi:hypothetical protein
VLEIFRRSREDELMIELTVVSNAEASQIPIRAIPA